MKFDIELDKTSAAFADINFSGNIIPELWYKNILLPNKKPDFISITILSDITYWYRPTEVRDEESGQLIGFKKKFKYDKLQRSQSQLAKKFGLSKKQVRESLDRLEGLGLIKTEFRQIGQNNNVLFIEPIADKVIEITSVKLNSKVSPPDHENGGHNDDSAVCSFPGGKESIIPKEPDALSLQGKRLLPSRERHIHRLQTTDYKEKYVRFQNPENESNSNNKNSVSSLNEKFEQFWNLYPNKKGKQDANKVFVNILTKTPELFDKIIQGLQNQNVVNEKLRARGAFVPNHKLPAGWLRDKRWEDEINAEEANETHRRSNNQNVARTALHEKQVELGRNLRAIDKWAAEEVRRCEEEEAQIFATSGTGEIIPEV